MKTKVNLCFYRQPRFSNNQQVIDRYKEIMSNPAYDVRTYGHVWYDANATFSSTSWTIYRPDYKANEKTLQNLHDNYQFERLLVESE